MRLERHILLFLLAVCCGFVSASCSCNRHSRIFDDELSALDAAIDSFDIVIASQQAKIAEKTLRLSMTRDRRTAMEDCLFLVNAYEHLAIDSLSKYASIYAGMARTPDEKALSAIKLSTIAQVKEDFVNSGMILRVIDTSVLSPQMKMRYLRHVESVNYSMFVRAFNSSDDSYLNRPADYYRRNLKSIRSEYLKLDSTSVNAVLEKVSEFRDDKLYWEALDCLLKNESMFISPREKMWFYRYKAVLYDFIGDEIQRIHALIMCEVYCFRQPTYDHLSLISLSRILAGRGDLDRAARYVSISSDYSRRFKHMARMANVSNVEKSILAMVDRERLKNKHRLYAAIAVLSIVSLFLIASLYYVTRTRKKISAANAKLKESDVIKDNYLFKYMAQSVDYLQQADEYHKSLRKLAKNDMDTLLAQLRLPSPFETQRKEFFKVYDRNFLILFPDFLENVNSLMKEDCRYEINSNGTMPVELRVLSAIRLGMTDSAQLSAFLSYSLATVYTYRSRAAEKSRYSRESFEKELLKIPL